MTGRAAVTLAALLLGLAAVMAVWLSIDRRPPEWDHANHLERAVLCQRSLAEPGGEALQEIIAESSFYPPIVTCAAGLLGLALPPLAAAHAVMWGFLVVGTLAVFGLGRRLLDPAAGLLAAFLFATAPFVVFSLLHFQLDLPLTAIVAVTLYALAHPEALAGPRGALGLGVLLGLGMLAKPPFAAYVSGALLWAAWLAGRAPDRRARLGRLLAAVGVAALIALPWYGPRLVGLPMQVMNRSFKQAAESGHAPALTSGALLFYPRWIVPQLGLLATLLLIGGVVAVARRERARGFVWAALAPAVIFFLIQNKNLRYTLPLLPAAALAGTAAVAALAPRARAAVTWACLAVGVLQVGSAAFALPSPTALAPVVPTLAFSQPPDGRDWHHRELLAAITAAAAGPGEPRVAVVANDNFFSVSNFRYEVVRDRLPLRLSRAWDQAPMGVDFAIVKTGDQGPDAASAKPDRIMAALGGGDPWLAAAYPVIARVPLPDGSEGMVRMRRLEPVRALAPAELAERLRRGAEGLLADVVRDARGLRMTLDYRDEGLLAGQVDHVTLEAESALVGEFTRRKPPLRVGPVRIRASGVLVNPGRLAATGTIELLDVRSLAVERLGISQEDLAEFLARQRGLSGLAATVERCGIGVHWTLPGPDLQARLGLSAGPDPIPFTLHVDGVSYGGLHLPGLLVRWIVRNFDPTPRLRRLPMVVSVAPISIGAGRVEIGRDPDPSCPPKEPR